MKKSSSESQALPRFKADIPDLKSLVDRLKEYFGKTGVSVKWIITISKTEYQIDDIEEIKTLPDLDARLHQMRLWISDGKLTERSMCTMRFGDSLIGLPRCSASGPNLAWCVGAVSIFTQFARKRRVWYSWLRGWHFMLLGIGLMTLPRALKDLMAHETTVTEWSFIGALSLLLILTGTFWWERFVPSAVIVIRPESNFIRRNKTELTIIIALVAALAAVGKLFITGA